MNRALGLFLIVVLAIGGFLAANTLFIVHQTRQALVLQFGEPVKVVQTPGLNFKLPFIQNTMFFDRRILDLDTRPEEVLASDQKRLVVDAFARFRITDPLVFFRTVTNEQTARIRLATLLNSALRSVLAEQEFATLLSGERSALMRQIRDQVSAEAQRFGIDVVDVRIQRADLPEANSQAIFRRMQTEREREAREARAEGQEIAQQIRSRADKDVTVLLAEANRDSEIIRGEGDAERNKIFAAAFGRDEDFFAFYRAMRAYETALQGSDTTMVLSPDSEFFRFFGDLEGRSPRRR